MKGEFSRLNNLRKLLIDIKRTHTLLKLDNVKSKKDGIRKKYKIIKLL